MTVSEAHPALSFALEFVEEFLQASGGERWRDGEMVESWSIDPERVEWVEYLPDDEDEDEDDG